MVSSAAEHEDQAWLLLEGLKKLHTKYPDRLDTVCRIALKKEEYTLSALKLILKSGEDNTFANTEESTPELSLHENIRGADYYKGAGASA